ncbi:CAP domain-containing protein [Micromonospora sp. R77]|uniref:CAP domain-containing protein n=1 Tax=Micromonospora sp. R77 TaxID=2925836 RepID=UPI001F6051AB|nr:CAP domain-containing protein [Micromonospora sp. R77]MCI4064731.1 CAP domain-containing protein [Micromonospora sp. R77]
MEATGVYGWTDPIDPDGAPRRPEPPTDQPPAWLTDRPEPRSSYLFGDEPQQPTEPPRWQSEPTGQLPPPVAPFERAAHDRTGELPYPVAPFERAAHDRTGELPYPVAPFERAAQDRTAPVDLAAVRATGADGPADGRHRNGRRFPRPLLIGGAAAAATLVVSLGVGALVLPGSDPRSDTTTVDDTVAAAPAVPDASSAPADALAAPSPTTSPSAAKPSPSPSRTVKPAPSRTTAPSRNLPRSSAPSTTTKAKTTSTGTGITAELQKVVDLVNAERAKAGCKALSVNSKLMTAAQRHSQDQADHRTMSHDGSDGSDVGQRLDRVGYAWRGYGENVAWNQQTPAAVMDAWMNSPGHRANILNCSFTQIGVGVARSNGPYWTQDFGTPR